MTPRTTLCAVLLSGVSAAGMFAQTRGGFPQPPEGSSAGPAAYSCGVPADPLPAERQQQAVTKSN